MDIRKYFKSSNQSRLVASTVDATHGNTETPLSSEIAVEETPHSSTRTQPDEQFRYDIGHYREESNMTDEIKLQYLKNVFKPDEKYNFKEDSPDSIRRFCYSWLERYKPWLAYSL